MTLTFIFIHFFAWTCSKHVPHPHPHQMSKPYIGKYVPINKRERATQYLYFDHKKRAPIYKPKDEGWMYFNKIGVFQSKAAADKAIIAHNRKLAIERRTAAAAKKYWGVGKPLPNMKGVKKPFSNSPAVGSKEMFLKNKAEAVRRRQSLPYSHPYNVAKRKKSAQLKRSMARSRINNDPDPEEAYALRLAPVRRRRRSLNEMSMG